MNLDNFDVEYIILHMWHLLRLNKLGSMQATEWELVDIEDLDIGEEQEYSPHATLREL